MKKTRYIYERICRNTKKCHFLITFKTGTSLRAIGSLPTHVCLEDLACLGQNILYLIVILARS